MKEFSFSRIRFRFHEWRREVCVVGERNESSAPGNPRYLLPTHPLPLSTHDHVNHSRDLIAPLHRTARCSRSRFISRGKRESALIRSNVQRGALIKAIPTRLPFFFFTTTDVRDRIVLFDRWLFSMIRSPQVFLAREILSPVRNF